MKTRHALLITATVAVCYSILLAFQAPEKLWDWWSGLAAAGISFFLAILAGISLYKQQTLEARATRKSELTSLLTAELSDLHRALNGLAKRTEIKVNGKTLSAALTIIQPLVVEHAALSGSFNTVQSENLVHFARKCRIYSMKVERFLSINLDPAAQHAVEPLFEDIESTRGAIVENIQQLCKQLNVTLSNSHRFA